MGVQTAAEILGAEIQPRFLVASLLGMTLKVEVPAWSALE